MWDPEKNQSEMPADIADAIKDLQPDVKARIEEVFKAYNDSERINSALKDLNDFFNVFENICKKYMEINALKRKLTAICKDNDLSIDTYYDSHKHCNFNIWDLININVHVDVEPPFMMELLDSFSISYIWKNNEHKEKVVQICELLKKEL